MPATPTPVIVFGMLVIALVWLTLPECASPKSRTPAAADFGRRSPLRSSSSLSITATVIIVTVVAVLWGGLVSIGIGLGVLALAFAIRFLVVQSELKRVRLQRQRAVIEFCDVLRGELQAGLPAARALGHACEVWAEWGPIASASSLGADIAAVLRSAADAPGAAGLRAIAAAWDVAGEAGAGLADVLTNIARGLRNDQDARAEVTAALGPTRATAKLLAVLPLFGLAMGTSMGAEPVGFMLETTVGRISLVSGALLVVAGLAWVERLASSLED